MKTRLTIRTLAMLLLLAAGFVCGVYASSHHLSPVSQMQAIRHAMFGFPHVDPAALIDYPYWRDRTTLFANLNSPVKNVMLGDSLTDGAEWQELFPNVSIANRGINGDTTYGLFKRLAHVVASHPARTFVMVGNNDILDHRPIGDIQADYLTVLEELSTQGIQTVIQSTLYVGNEVADADYINTSTEQLNTWLKAQAASRGWTFVDLNQLLAPRHTLNAEWSHDGIHLNGQGYQVWKEAIAGYLSR